ncbi:hypothetical protein [Roseomonas genomospecies 6]|uniref:hypothetical protein n=1 Tax=Roseomonas genomospecies 6 TaxID=214106 RepID=UPI00142ED69D|nr:hypothetical protein [Roseomonas genomospecies 6]
MILFEKLKSVLAWDLWLAASDAIFRVVDSDKADYTSPIGPFRHHGISALNA